MSKDNGGPAFPCERECGPTLDSAEGMTLRDYFAAKAIPVVWNDIPDDTNRDTALFHLGACCYEMADAMLKAREV